MESKKLIKEVALGLICLSLLVSVGFNIFLYKQLKQVPPSVDQESPITGSTSVYNEISKSEQFLQKSTTQNTTSAKGKAPDVNDSGELEYQLDAAEEELDMAQDQLSEEVSKKREYAKGLLEQQKKIMEDPSFVKRMRETTRRLFEPQYEKLFKDLNLSDEAQEKLLDLIVNKSMASSDISTDLMNVDTPSEKLRAEFKKRYEDLDTEYKTKINGFLGSSNYEIFQAFGDRLSPRHMVTNFNEGLGANEKLSEPQQDQFIESLYETMKSIRSERGTEEREILFRTERYTEKRIAEDIEKTKQDYEKYVSDAKSILSASQSEQFETYLNKNREQTESSMKRSSYIYGTK